MKQEHRMILELSTSEGIEQHGALDETPLPFHNVNEATYIEHSQQSPLSRREELLPQDMKQSKKA
eukprot:4609043-Karenia_brevis.AAC.1